MKSRLLAGTAGVVLLGLAGPAMADPDGWYGALDLGYHWQGDFVLESEGLAPDGDPYAFDFATDPSWAGFVRLGYRFNPNWRVELEGGYRPGDLTSAVSPDARTPPTSVALCTPGVIRGPTTPCGGPEGSVDQWSLMGNLIWDMGDDDWRLRPFVGVGAGFNRVSVDSLGQFSTSPAGPSPANLQIDDEDTGFAWQVLGGFAWALSDRLNLDLTARYMKTSDVSFESISTSSATGFVPGSFEGDFEDSSVSIGLRWAFGQ